MSMIFHLRQFFWLFPQFQKHLTLSTYYQSPTLSRPLLASFQTAITMKTLTSSKKLNVVMEKWRKRKKGHFVVYSREGKRFVVPLCYLNHPSFRVLLEMAEEQAGTRVTGPIQVPCEEFMDYILSILRKNPSEEGELSSIHN